MSHFAPVRVNETLTLDFDNRDRFEMHHYDFHVSDAEFDAIFGRIKEAGIPYGSGPYSQDDMKTNYLERRPRRLFQRSQRPRPGASHANLSARVAGGIAGHSAGLKQTGLTEEPERQR